MPIDKEALKKNASPKDVFQFRDGDNLVRIMPPTSKYFTENIAHFDLKMFVHYNLGPEGSPPIACPRTKDETTRCPICETARRLRRSPTTKELASELSRRTRFIANILDVEHPERGIQIAEYGPTVHDPIFDVVVDREYGEVLDLKVGRNFKITLTPANRSKTGFNSYAVLAGANPSDIRAILPPGKGSKTKLDTLNEKIDALQDRIGTPPSFEELERLVNAATGGQGTSESEPQAPTHVRTSPVTSQEFVDPKGQDSVVRQGSDGSPKDDAESAAATPDPASEATPASNQPAAGAPAGVEACWGENFQPSAEKCKGCKDKASCMEKYVEG